MTRQWAATVLAILLVGVAASWVFLEGETPAREPERGAEKVSPAPPRPGEVALRGREPHTGSLPDGTRVGTPTPPGPDPLAAELTAQARAEALVATIRRDVEPDFWDANLPGGTARLAVRGDLLEARATDDVLDGIQEWLDGRRYAADAGPEVDAGTRRRALGELQVVLRRMRLQEVRLAGAVVALRGGDLDTARRHLTIAKRFEPDNLAVDDLFALVVSLESEGTPDLGGIAGSAAMRRWTAVHEARSLMDWILLWPSESTCLEALAHRKAAGPAPVGLRGEERQAVLERGSVTVHADHTALRDVLRAVQVESLVDVVADERLPRPLLVERLHAEGRPLQEVLDRLLSVLGDRYVWRASSRTIELTEPALRPLLRQRFFDVEAALRAGPLRGNGGR